MRGFEFEFVEGANDMIATANESTPIRMFSSDFNEKGWFRQYSKVPLDNCKGEWFTNTSKNVAPMSAVSYCFATGFECACRDCSLFMGRLYC